MYVTGTPDVDPDDGDWACEYVWEPEDRYNPLDGSAAVDLDGWRPSSTRSLLLQWSSRGRTGRSICRGVGVGFDDGDVGDVVVVWTRA